MKILFNYRDQTQRCNSRLDLFESQLRASTSPESNTLLCFRYKKAPIGYNLFELKDSSKWILLRHMRHQELWRAVGTHYGQTRIYGPTDHAIRGTAQQALLSFYRVPAVQSLL